MPRDATETAHARHLRSSRASPSAAPQRARASPRAGRACRDRPPRRAQVWSTRASAGRRSRVAAARARRRASRVTARRARTSRSRNRASVARPSSLPCTCSVRKRCNVRRYETRSSSPKRASVLDAARVRPVFALHERRRRCDEHEPRNASGTHQRPLQRDLSAERPAEHASRRIVVDRRVDRVGERRQVDARDRRRATVSGKVDHVHAMRARKRVQQRREQPSMHREAVQQHERRPGSDRFDVKRGVRDSAARAVDARHADVRVERSDERRDVGMAVRGGQRYRAAARCPRAPSAAGWPARGCRARRAPRTRAPLPAHRRRRAAGSASTRRAASTGAPRRSRGTAPISARELRAPRRLVANAAQRLAQRLGEERRRGRRVDVRRAPSGSAFRSRADARRRTRRTRRRPCRAWPCRRCVGDATPKCASAPRPPPSTPMPCASSTTQPRVVRSASASRSAQRRDVAVHAEDGVGDDAACARVGRGEHGCERRHVAVRIAVQRRARQQRAVVQARVVQAVGEDGVAAPRERGEDREVGEIAAREEERARAGAGCRRRRRARARAPRARPCGRRRDATRPRPRRSARRRVHAASTSAGCVARPR